MESNDPGYVPPKKLAITIAGAVSLGCYEAGVLYEILDAIHHHNNDEKTKQDPKTRIEIDVLTGASAGGMTAIILAQKLLYGASEFVGPYDNPLYNTWVNRIDLRGLQDTQPDEPALHSLFSSDLVVKISREALMARYGYAPKPPASSHAAVDPARPLQIGVALTNLNGVDYGYKTKPDGEFIYREYSDEMTRTIGPNSDNADFWEPLRKAAVASGAFPIAFRAQDVERSAKEADVADYPTDNLYAWKHDPRIFTYSDGGILQNQPLGMAKNLVDLVPGHLDQESRFYLFVSPHAKDAGSVDDFSEAGADYAHMIGRLIKVVIGQAGFRDWITAREINERIHTLDDRASGLTDAISERKLDVPSLQVTATALLSLLFPNGWHQPPGARMKETLVEAQERIARQYRKEMADLGSSGIAGAAVAFRDSILAFESAAGLGARDEMRIYGITATESELASAGLQSFLGFFDRTFRDHDYDVGRLHARKFLTDKIIGDDGEIGPFRGLEKLKPIRTIDSRLDGIKLGRVPAGDLDDFKAGMRARVNQMIDELTDSRIEAGLAKLAVDQFLKVGMELLIHKY